MSDHLIIYLDESGELGFDFTKKGTNQFFVIGLLVCKAVKQTKQPFNLLKKH